MGKFIVHKNVITEKWSMSDFHSHNYYEVYLLKNGSRDLLINNQIYTITENTMIFIPPFVSHKTEGGPFERTNFYFPINFINETERNIFNNIAMQGPIILRHSVDTLIFKLIDLIEKYYSENNDDSDDIIHSLFCSIILLLSENLSKIVPIEQKNQLPQDMVKALSYIKENYRSEISASSVANAIFLTTDYFCKKFKRFFNCSFSEYVLNLRITEAQKHLQLTDSSISDIAESVGFSSANYFSLIFKKRVGQSPQTYRKTNKIINYTINATAK